MLGKFFQRWRRRPARRNFRRAARRRGGRRAGETVLDVKLPPSRREAGLVRMARWRLVVIGLGVAGGLAGAAFGARRIMARHFWGHESFLVKAPEIVTNGTLAHEEILRQAGIDEGMHVYRVDLEGARARLESLPLVRRASVQRTAAGRLAIAVEERVPAAWLACEAPPVQAFTSDPARGGFLLDEEGVLFACGELKPRLMKLPVICVRRLPAVQAGAPALSESVRGALDLLRHSRAILNGRALDVVEIDAPNDWSLTVKFSDDMTAAFALDDLPGQWRRLAHVLDLAAAEGRRPATINLLPEKNVAVTFFDSPPAGLPGADADATGRARMTRPRDGAGPPVSPAPATRSRTEAALDEILGGGN